MNNTLLKTARLSTALALTLSTAGPRPVRAQIAPALAAVQSVALQTDVDGDGQADPGDTLRYTLVVSNTGGADAQAVNLTEALDANTTLTGAAQATPLALGDVYTASNAAPLMVASPVGLLANDFGLPAPTVTTQSAQPTTAGGSVSVAASGAFTYTAPSGYTGGDSFSYAIANASGADIGTVSLQVYAPPQAVADGYSTVQDTPLTIAAGSGLLVNDTVAGGALTAYAAASSEGGSVAVRSDGGFVYTPPAGFFSPPIDTFTYTLSNPVGQSTATVTLTVELPGPPLAVGDSFTATANARLTVPAAGVLANDTRNSATISAYATASAQGGTVALVADGGFTYDPPPDFISPPTDTFTYTLSNALGDSTAIVTLNVRPPGAPLVSDDAYTTTANTQLSVPALTGLLANDTPNLAVIDSYATTTTRGGSVVLAPTGAFTYTPPSDTISPPTDSFTYTLSNALGSATGTVMLTIDPPGAPSATDDAYVATAEVELSVDATSGAFANDALNFAALAGYAATTSRGGSVTLAPTGAFTYTPPAGTVSPPVDSFTYTVENPLGDATATVRITINPPGAPLAVADGYTTTVNTNLSVAGPGVLANDTANFGTLSDYATTTTRGGGIVLAPTGAFTYTPPTDTVSPPTDSFTYTVSNVLGESTATVTLTIAPPAAPQAEADAYTAVANTDLVVAAGAGVLANDTPNWGALDAYAAATARGGSVVLAPTGAFTYTPPTDTISPPTDSFTYTLSNLLGASTATVTLTIDPPAPPLAVAETYTATVNVPYTVAAPGVLANDTLNFGALTDYATISAAGGGVQLAPSGAFTYTSATDVLGTDTYTYTLSNSLGSSTATVIVNVLPPPPVAAADAYTTTGNVDLTVTAPGGVLNNDTLNWATLTASATTSAQGGAVSVSADGGFSYSPATGFTGTDTFTYTLGNAAATSTATVTVTVSERVWFVDNTAAAGGDGRHSAPFDTLAEAASASTANDILYVYYGDGTSTGQNAGITLKAGQRLLGQHVALVVNGATIEPAISGSRPVVTTASGNTITAPAATGVEVRGLALSGGASGDLVALTTSGAANAGLTLSDCTLTASGNSGVDITQ
ncbi:MAG TPA: Ig-like domain-containing protein, partial [Anaerolineales bacterium]|nr:Ig-like domain-containing protein [Anaerolineales bacterium]